MSQQPYQDWDTIVFRKKQQNLKGEGAARAAVRNGATSSAVPRASGPNKASDDARRLIKVENEDTPQESIVFFPLSVSPFSSFSLLFSSFPLFLFSFPLFLFSFPLFLFPLFPFHSHSSLFPFVDSRVVSFLTIPSKLPSLLSSPRLCTPSFHRTLHLAPTSKLAPTNTPRTTSVVHTTHIGAIPRLTALAHPTAVKHVSREVSLRIQKGRQAKGWTQKDLATRINEKQTVVNEYESCRAIPNNAILGKMERALGVKLRGKLN